MNISGTALGGTGSSAFGANNVSTGTINISGTALGGSGSVAHGARNQGAGTIRAFSAIGGIGGVGVSNDTTNGRVEVKRAIGNAFGIGSTGIAAAQVGVANVRSGIAVVEEIESGSRGVFPTSGPMFFKKTSDSVAIYRNSSGDQITMFTSASGSNLVPSPQDVRKNVEYDFGSRTGTLAMPTPETVNFGVPVDNTVGSGVFTPLGVWNLPVSAIGNNLSMGTRVKNSATIDAVGSLITNLT
jgi:FlaG/FlaF family flagellin (archaellin)